MDATSRTERTPSAYPYPLLIRHMLERAVSDHPASLIVYGQTCHSYRQLRERVGRLADALAALGVGRGSTVGVMDWDTNRYLECFYAVPMMGAVLHMVNVRLSPEQIVYTINHAADDILLVNVEFLPLLERIAGQLRTVRAVVLLDDEGKAREADLQGLRCAGEYEALVLEGAGSPAEINLRDRDIVNMGMAEMAQCPVILVADIDRGGVFAAIYGTLALLQPQERARVKGVIINKFRGDVALLRSGIEQIEALTGVPVLGVMPWLDVDLEDEDGVALQAGKYHRTDRRDIDIAVVHLPHIANFTDFNALAAQPDVRVRYVRDPQALADADLVILPGSKNTLGDLCWLRESGMAHAVEQARQRKVPLLGICGGYQMLGETIIDEVESGLGAQPGLGVLKTVTHFAQHKTTTQVQATLGSALPDWLADAAGLRVSGYEIHMGETELRDGCRSLMQLHKGGQSVADGAVSDDGLAFGTYLHGLFDTGELTEKLVALLCRRKGIAPDSAALIPMEQYRQQQFDLLADGVRGALDLDAVYAAMGLENPRRNAQ